MQLNYQQVLITGGGSGIGLALAKELDKLGKRVLICGRNAERLKQAAGQLSRQAHTFQCDISSSQDRQALQEYIAKHFSELDCLINNAGIQHNINLLDGPDSSQKLRDEVDINLLAPIELTQQLLPDLLTRKHSAVVNITSCLAYAPKFRSPGYSTSKAAFAAYTHALRLQLRDNPNIKVIEVVPPMVSTEMTEGRGKLKLTPQQMASATLSGISANKKSIWVGKAKALRVLRHLLPALATKIVNKE